MLLFISLLYVKKHLGLEDNIRKYFHHLGVRRFFLSHKKRYPQRKRSTWIQGGAKSRFIALTNVAPLARLRPTKRKDRWFDSRSGHMLGLQARSPDGVQTTGNWLMFVSLSISLPFPLSENKSFFKKAGLQLWLVWLNRLSTGLWTKWVTSRIPLGAHAWATGQVPSRGRARGNHTLMFLSLSFSLTLSKIKSF